MAWVGLAAVVGLALCGLWALADRVRDRAARRAGSEPDARPRSTAVSLGLIAVVGILLFVVVGFLFVTDLEGSGGGESSSAPRVTTTTVPKGPRLHPPQQVRIAIVNASGFLRPASEASSKLRAAGFVVTGTTSAPVRQGSAIQCHNDFTIDAKRLVLVLGVAPVFEPFPDAPPVASTAVGPTITGVDSTGVDPAAVDCVVIVGR